LASSPAMKEKFCNIDTRWQLWSQICYFYLVKNHKIANNLSTAEARAKLSTDLESFEFQKFLDVCFTKLENSQILLNKISHRFLVTTKLFSGWKSLFAVIFFRLNSIKKLFTAVIYEC
jgi:hypothetical protein